jgi:hypothetical protein
MLFLASLLLPSLRIIVAGVLLDFFATLKLVDHTSSPREFQLHLIGLIQSNFCAAYGEAHGHQRENNALNGHNQQGKPQNLMLFDILMVGTTASCDTNCALWFKAYRTMRTINSST